MFLWRFADPPAARQDDGDDKIQPAQSVSSGRRPLVIPGLSVVAVILIVLVLAFILNWGLFRPITRIMREREAAIRAATEAAEIASAKAAEATAQFERKMHAAKADLYHRWKSLARRARRARGVLAAARREVEATLTEATARLEAQVNDARKRLEQDADALGTAVAERMLGRKVS
jgi:F-type H+-transporting ATPase subunit b